MASTTVHTRKTVASRARMRMASRHCLTGPGSGRLSGGAGATELQGNRL